jgi:hypothetical protein
MNGSNKVCIIPCRVIHNHLYYNEYHLEDEQEAI